MDKTTYWKMIDDVARQMCILANLNPDEMVHCPRSHGETRDFVLSLARERFAAKEFLTPMMYAQQPAYVAFGKDRVPSFVSIVDDHDVQMPRWRTYRAAASDAILGSYAVKQVLLAGGPVEK